jgi:ribosomal protein L40E
MSVQTCPTCGAEAQEGARSCRSCGTPVDEREDHSCAVCGHVNPPDSSFCRACGRPLAAAQAGPPAGDPTLVQQAPQWPPPPPGPRTSAGVVVAIFVGVLLVAGGGVAAAVLLTRGHPHHPAIRFAATNPTTTTVTETTASQPTTTEAATAGASATSTSSTTSTESSATANPYSEVPQIETVLREFHEDVLSTNLQGAWELTSFRYRKEKEAEASGYATWVTNQKTLQGHLDPSGLKVSIYSWESQQQVATVRVTGMRWNEAGSPCTHWQGITWMRHEGTHWYYEPGYSVSPQRTAQWAGHKSALLGWGCV